MEMTVFYIDSFWRFFFLANMQKKHLNSNLRPPNGYYTHCIQYKYINKLWFCFTYLYSRSLRPYRTLFSVQVINHLVILAQCLNFFGLSEKIWQLRNDVCFEMQKLFRTQTLTIFYRVQFVGLTHFIESDVIMVTERVTYLSTTASDFIFLIASTFEIQCYSFIMLIACVRLYQSCIREQISNFDNSFA